MKTLTLALCMAFGAAAGWLLSYGLQRAVESQSPGWPPNPHGTRSQPYEMPYQIPTDHSVVKVKPMPVMELP